MAVVKAPLLSLGASGKLAGTIVFGTWKGRKVAREYVIPANPQTAAQVTQRGYFTDCVAQWRNYFTGATMRQAWNRSATAEGRVESGFNSAMRAMLGVIGTDPESSFASACVAAAGEIATWTVLNMDDGVAGDEAGNFEIWVGSSPDALLYLETAVIAAGEIDSSDLGDVDDVKYVQLKKGGFNRSGISKITLIA